MADLIYSPRRPGIRLIVHTADIVSVIKQPDVVASMTDEEVTEIADVMIQEFKQRTEGKENVTTETK